MMRRLLLGWYALAYYVSWGSFMLGGLMVSLCSVPLLPWRGRPGVEKMMRAVQRGLFRLWTWWLHTSGVVRVYWHGFEEALQLGTVYIATHPTLIDAPLLLGRLPDSVCVVKQGVMSNPALGSAAVMAGYVTGADGIDMVRVVAEKIRKGRALLIFPEGTRTEEGALLNPFKPGFALIASRAGAPVRLVVARSSRGLVTRGRAWWRLPTVLPGRMDFTLDKVWEYEPGRSASELTAEVQAYVLARLRDSA